LNILGIAPYAFLPPQMGGQKYIEIFYRYVGAEVNTTVASTQNNAESYVKNYRLEKVFDDSKSRYSNPACFFRLKKLVKQYNITHIIIEHPYMGWLAVALQKALGVKLIVHSHNVESERFKSLDKWWWKPLQYYEKWVHRKADYSFFITEPDMQYAIEHFGLDAAKCSTSFYGIEVAHAPTATQKRAAKEHICKALQLPFSTNILLFNGNFSYKPNNDALLVLLNTVVPSLNKDGHDFKLIICGKDIGEEMKARKVINVLMLDFVPDITIYNLAADIFLNPVVDGGGVKTKLVEALAANTQVVSTRSGANGVKQEWCGNKLAIVDDNDWTSFCDAIKTTTINNEPVRDIFFQKFYMGNIAAKVKETLRSLTL
jgi:glycosyltransferase involved in cell wall biosynthesis